MLDRVPFLEHATAVQRRLCEGEQDRRGAGELLESGLDELSNGLYARIRLARTCLMILMLK